MLGERNENSWNGFHVANISSVFDDPLLCFVPVYASSRVLIDESFQSDSNVTEEHFRMQKRPQT